MSTTRPRAAAQWTITIIGPPVVAGIAWLMSLPGSDADRSVSVTNVALVIAVLTAGVALVDWIGGALTSVTAAVALNFYHTEPFRTLRITDRTDVISVLLLAVLGIGVSASTAIRVRREISAAVTERRHAATDQWVEQEHAVQSAARAWQLAVGVAAAELALFDVRIDEEPSDLPLIGRDIEGTDVMVPPSGAALRLTGRPAAWLTITPRPGLGARSVDRRALILLVETLSLARSMEAPADRPAVDA
jgi:hypothetical protein